MESILDINQIYYDVSNPAGYSSVNKLTKAMNGTMKKTSSRVVKKSRDIYVT